MNADCPARAALEAFAAGALTGGASSELETHLERCSACAQELETITRSLLQELVGAEAPRIKEARHAFLDPPKAPGALGSFAGYEVTEIAGSGAMGVVLKAHDPTLQRTVAIKVLSPSRAWDEQSADRFLREARTIAAIQHDHVVVVHTAGREKGLPYLVMPFHADGTLEQFLHRTSRLAPADVIRVGIQLARALEVTHANGVLHRDVKPSNILLEDGLKRVRLADFGLAHSLDSTRRTVAGTPHYMSPEQARGERIDARSDLFGLGAVLFRLATGETVYDGKSAQETLQAAAGGHRKSIRETNADVVPALAAIINRLLASDPNDRFASAGEVAAALLRAANRRRKLIKRAVISALAGCVLLATSIGALDATGKTAVVNTMLCESSGDGYFIRGQFGTYAELPDAVEAARAGDIIEARFSGERVVRNFRTGRKPLTIRAARGFTPTLYATNNAQSFILADGPLTLEGLSLVRRVKGIAFTPLIAAENAPVALLNCRIFRSLPTPGDPIIRSGRLHPVQTESERIFPPLITLDSRSECLMHNCLILGLYATGIAFRGESPTRAEIENTVFVIHRAFSLRAAEGFRVDIRGADSLLLGETILDLGDAEMIDSATATWTNCFFDLPEGTVLQVTRHSGNWQRNFTWRETNCAYSGPLDWIVDRTGRRFPLGKPITERHLFSGVVIRPAPQLHAADANTSGLRMNFQPGHVGEGKFYETFRGHPDYRHWQAGVRAVVDDWQRRQVAARQIASPVAHE